MKKSIFLFFAAILCAMSVSAGDGFYGIYIKYHQNGQDKTSDGEWTSPLNVGTLTTDFKITNVYLKVWWENWSPSPVCGQLHYWKDGTEVWPGLLETVKSTGGNNREIYAEGWNYVLASPTEASGKHEITYKWEAYLGSVTHTLPSNGTKKITYTVLPPNPKTISCTSNGDGLGTEDSPFQVPLGKTLTISVNGTQNHDDANSVLYAKFVDAYTSDVSHDIIPTTTKQSITITAKYYNATDELSSSEEKSITVYYQAVEEENHDVLVAYKYGETVLLEEATIEKVGISTATPVTAPAITGYTFSSWDLGSGVQSADATTNPINITTKSGETDYTLVANYNEDLTSGWVLKGTFVDDFATAYDFTKKSGESTGKVAYTTVELVANTEYQFKVVENGSNWYGNNNSDEEWWIKQTVENWDFYNNNTGNCHMKTGLAGTYTFKIDYSGSNPKVSVIYPKVATVTVEDPIGCMSTYTGVEENDGVWSKEYNVGEEVTLGIDELDSELVFAYWSVGAEKIFTEEYTFTASEDVTVTAVYALPTEVTFDNMTLDTDSWIVEAGPDTEYGVTVTLGIDVEGEHPKGFGLVDGSQIYLGEDELELVTGYFTAVDQDAPSAEAVIIAVYAEELMAFVCTMSAAATPAIPVEVLDGVATPNDVTGELWITGQWEGDDVYVQVPGFDGVSFDCPEIWFYVGGTDFETASIIARGPATITVDGNDVLVEGTVMSGMTGTNYDLFVIGTLPAAVTTIDVTLSGMQKSQSPRMGRGYTALEDAAGNKLQIYNESAEWAYGEYTVTGELVEYGVTVQGTGIWNVVDGVETLTATLQVEDDNTTIYNVTATVGAATTITLECRDATYTITDPEFNEVTFTGVADGKEFTILVSYFGGEYYSEGEWGETFIMGTEIEFDDSDAEEYYLGGTYIDDASNTYEVLIFATPAVVEPETYTRTVTANNYGTICLPFASDEYAGAEFYEVSSLVVGQGLWLDQVPANATLVAGKPYIFKATAAELVVVSNGTTADAPVAGVGGLTGTFTDIEAGDTDLVGNYIIAENKVWIANASNTLPANRAYINAEDVPTTAQAQIPGRRRVCMGENAATGLDNITNGENITIKVIENGQLIIIRNGEKFNAQGIQL